MKKKLVLLLATLMCISLCACGGSEGTSGDNTNTQKEESGGLFKTKKEIEITLDNWQEYFEIKPVLKDFDFEKNAFDEIEDLEIEYGDAGTAFCLKEEYVDKFVSADIAVEINTNQADGALFKYNMGTDTYEMEYLNDYDKSVSYFYEMVSNFTDRTYSEKVNDVECLIVPNGHMSVLGEIEGDIVNIYVLACPNSEVTRIQGTLTIKE